MGTPQNGVSVSTYCPKMCKNNINSVFPFAIHNSTERETESDDLVLNTVWIR